MRHEYGNCLPVGGFCTAVPDAICEAVHNAYHTGYIDAATIVHRQLLMKKEKPLTLEELRQMNGEPVWIDDWFEDSHGWELSVDATDYFDGEGRTENGYGTQWVAYRSRPKEDE